jgi:hypothetical protein
MRTWASDNKMKLLAHLLTIVSEGHAEHTMTAFEQVVMQAMKERAASAETVDKPITPLN